MADDAPRRDAALVALDWGTTTFRAWLLDATGAVVDGVRTADGALSLSERADSPRARAAAFEATFSRLCRPWLDEHPGIPVLCSGMAGSNLGWADAGYLDVPAELGGLAYRLTVVPAGDSVVHLVPGLRATGPLPDVMRGEEVQLVGALAAIATEHQTPAGHPATPDRRHTVVLPGTHSKWVRLDGDCVAGFATAMTGELYGLLLRDSILGRLAEGEPGTEASDAFTWGLEAEAEHGDERGLPALLFTARTLVLAGRLAGQDVADYLSGLLIGAEVRHALRAEPADVVVLCGSPSTTHRYRLALERSGVAVRAVGEDATARGLWRVALDAGLASLDPASLDPAPLDPAPLDPTEEQLA
ncbi:2-dehydro-3-deoxygalactonokinase [Promicromonospora sp. NPDC060204]|uniref:2-dehydro-3-deoxygalactonokinase n=1 Tax=Promicromonospora sp. NPDC060204 TaxID=3347071 RepID=UPI0036636E2A